MKKIYGLLFIFVLSTALSFGQSAKEYEDFIKSGVRLTTKELIYEALELTEEEEAKFDRVFTQYLDKRQELAKERLPLLVEYAERADRMTPDELWMLNKTLMKNSRKLANLNKKYYNKARRAIPIEKATAFFLAEKYLRNEVEIEIIDLALDF